MLKLKLLLTSAILLILTACGGAAATSAPVAPVAEIDVSALPLTIDVQTAASVQDRDDVILIDVREQSEYDAGHIPGITLVPMSEIQNRLDEIPTDKEVIVTCRSGNRSSQVTDFLRKNGFDNVHNMQGGIIAWEQAGYPVEQ
jgi:rhodanese-related sulfurtransferase